MGAEKHQSRPQILRAYTADQMSLQASSEAAVCVQTFWLIFLLIYKAWDRYQHVTRAQIASMSGRSL